MLQFLARRAVIAIPTTLIALVLVFLAIRVVPNNPVLARFGQHAVPEKVAEEMARQGWDQPLFVQLGRFLHGLVLHGELGDSFFFPESVVEGLRRTFPATVELTLAAIVIAVPLGIIAGISAAVWHNRLPDYFCMTISLLGVSVPVFFLGLCLLYIFPAMPPGWRLPPGAIFDRTTEFIALESTLRGRWDVLGASLAHLCLPALALSTIPMAYIARVTRSSMLEILSADFVRTARAKGSPPWRVVLRHAFPNASLPVVNIGGLQFGQLLSGAVLTESVFNWPGLGRYIVQAVQHSDYNAVQGGTLLVAFVFVGTNLAVDALFAYLDPRVRLDGTAHG